jgi:hypothetical protein
MGGVGAAVIWSVMRHSFGKNRFSVRIGVMIGELRGSRSEGMRPPSAAQ